MGADQVGYLVKGPLRITDSMIRKAIRHMTRGVKVHRCGICSDVVEDNMCSCGAEVAVFKTPDEAAEKAKEFAAGWHPEWRDTTWRLDPDNKRKIILYAGEMTWGDAPSGGGYAYLKSLQAAGLFEVWGIR